MPRPPNRRIEWCIPLLTVVMLTRFSVLWSQISFSSTDVANAELAAILPQPRQFQESTDRSRAKKKSISLLQQPTHHACDSHKGILHIGEGDDFGGFGSVFFMFVMNQLIYAERYNLKPWVHLNNRSRYIFDPQIHGEDPSLPPQTFTMKGTGRISTNVWVDPILQKKKSYPGRPFPFRTSKDDASHKTFEVTGNGVWSTYFEPVSDFVPGDRSCRDKPLFRLSSNEIIPGLHYFCPWALHAWSYGGMAPSLKRKRHQTYREWFAPQRAMGHAMVQKYYRVRPEYQRLAETANPKPSSSAHCLSIHIRQSDKKAGHSGRRIHNATDYLPFVQAYLNAGGDPWIYLATDSTRVLQEIRDDWPAHIQSMIHTQDTIVRSQNETAVFVLDAHHRTNTEALVDILALSQCDFFLHGLSALAEAAIYMNPQLHNQSANLDDRWHPPRPSDFQSIVQQALLT